MFARYISRVQPQLSHQQQTPAAGSNQSGGAAHSLEVKQLSMKQSRTKARGVIAFAALNIFESHPIIQSNALSLTLSMKLNFLKKEKGDDLRVGEAEPAPAVASPPSRCCCVPPPPSLPHSPAASGREGE